MSVMLPVTNRQLVDECAAELMQIPPEDHTERGDSARMRYAWALAHSDTEADNEQCVAWLTHQLQRDADLRGRREPLYLLAVATFKLGHTLQARDWATEALRVAPACSQSRALRDACESRLAEDALIAVTAGGVAVAGLAMLLGALAGAKRTQ